ncbi:MAG: prepilin-type N-terminal cleavage/methylation domain-containing protein [Gemmatimonadaceae bacterium]
MLTARRGVTLIELVVSMLIGGMVLGLVASVSVRQQRIYSDIADGEALSGQLRDAAAVLPIDLRGASPGGGDIRSGEARDTSIELRATISTAVVCDTTTSALVLSPTMADSVGASFGSTLSAIQAGDTAWVFSASDSSADWVPHAITAVSTVPGAACAALGPRLSGSALFAARAALVLDGIPILSSAIGQPIRVTRPLRYSLYKSSDGAWYLGERDWNPSTKKFNTIQPVSGPYLSPASRGVSFSYLDSVGAVLPTPVSDTRGIALVRVALRGVTRAPVRALGSAASIGGRVDSVVVSVLLRNRR